MLVGISGQKHMRADGWVGCPPHESGLKGAGRNITCGGGWGAVQSVQKEREGRIWRWCCDDTMCLPAVDESPLPPISGCCPLVAVLFVVAFQRQQESIAGAQAAAPSLFGHCNTHHKYSSADVLPRMCEVQLHFVRCGAG